MRRIATFTICLFFVSTLVWGAETPSESQSYWPQWRGPEMTGVAPYGEPPMEWSEDKNIRWKIEIPGKGHASPIVWDDKVFVLTAIETDKVTAQVPNWPTRLMADGSITSARPKSERIDESVAPFDVTLGVLVRNTIQAPSIPAAPAKKNAKG